MRWDGIQLHLNQYELMTMKTALSSGGLEKATDWLHRRSIQENMNVPRLCCAHSAMVYHNMLETITPQTRKEWEALYKKLRR
jgi:abortive infection bacteriophage resistance protein